MFVCVYVCVYQCLTLAGSFDLSFIMRGRIFLDMPVEYQQLKKVSTERS